jgi:hypothetical protein
VTRPTLPTGIKQTRDLSRPWIDAGEIGASLRKPQAEYPVAIRRQELLHLTEDFGRNVGALDLPEEPFHLGVAIALFG